MKERKLGASVIFLIIHLFFERESTRGKFLSHLRDGLCHRALGGEKTVALFEVCFLYNGCPEPVLVN
eukprot:COSAG06_NODE_13828_length_1215_cov_2.051971_1_plen_67_part_00